MIDGGPASELRSEKRPGELHFTTRVALEQALVVHHREILRRDTDVEHRVIQRLQSHGPFSGERLVFSLIPRIHHQRVDSYRLAAEVELPVDVVVMNPER